MMNLKEKALASSVIPEAAVAAIYDDGELMGLSASQTISKLCLSHERLRAEVAGYDYLVEYDVRRFVELCTRLDEVAQLGDTGSEIFKAVFAPEAEQLGFVMSDVTISGWRVAEMMRQKVLDCLAWLNRWKKGT